MPSRRRQEPTPYNHPRWPRIRRIVLARDHRICQIQSAGCQREATDVDHIVPWRDGGAWFDLDNLRASCSHCNISRASHQKHQRGWERSDTHIVLVDRGLPVAADPHDTIIDYRRIVAAVAPHDEHHPEHSTVADVIYRKLIAELRRGELDAGRVWVVVDDPTNPDELPYHTRIGGHPDDDQESAGSTALYA